MAISIEPFARSWPPAFQHTWATVAQFLTWNSLNMIPYALKHVETADIPPGLADKLAKFDLYRQCRSLLPTVSACKAPLDARKSRDSATARKKYKQILSFAKKWEYETNIPVEEQISIWMPSLFCAEFLWTEAVIFATKWANGPWWLDIKERLRPLADSLDEEFPDFSDRGSEMYHDISDILRGA